jgi:L-ascorbate metabolism protein UlaG (beta-lactamase superfamily)
MKITKYSHACLLVEVNGVSIITDPGSWNKTPDATAIDAILITHEHGDHCDIGQIKEMLARCPNARIITHESVGKQLAEEGLKYEVIESGATIDVNGVSIQSFGTAHACIYGDVSPCRNTGYLINAELFAPGDALHDVPPQGVRVLALPTGGPWMRISEAIDYAKRVQPKIVFPIHDAMYIEEYRSGLMTRLVGGNLDAVGIKYTDLAPGETKEF